MNLQWKNQHFPVFQFAQGCNGQWEYREYRKSPAAWTIDNPCLISVKRGGWLEVVFLACQMLTELSLGTLRCLSITCLKVFQCITCPVCPLSNKADMTLETWIYSWGILLCFQLCWHVDNSVIPLDSPVSSSKMLATLIVSLAPYLLSGVIFFALISCELYLYERLVWASKDLWILNQCWSTVLKTGVSPTEYGSWLLWGKWLSVNAPILS